MRTAATPHWYDDADPSPHTPPRACAAHARPQGPRHNRLSLYPARRRLSATAIAVARCPSFWSSSTCVFGHNCWWWWCTDAAAAAAKSAAGTGTRKWEWDWLSSCVMISYMYVKKKWYVTIISGLVSSLHLRCVEGDQDRNSGPEIREAGGPSREHKCVE